MRNRKSLKIAKSNPNRDAIAKYEEEIEYWENEMHLATERSDWSRRNLASTNLMIKRKNLELLIEKSRMMYGRRSA